MSDNNDLHRDELLDEAIAALRDAPVPEGPAPQTVFRTRSALREAEQEPKKTLFGRILTMTLNQRIAAAVGISVGGIILYAVFQLFSTLGGTVAYADVAKQIREARTLQCLMTITSAELPEPIRMKVFMAEGGRVRMEWSKDRGGTIQIIDTGQGKALALNPAMKLAFIAEMDKPGEVDDQMLNLLSEFQQLAEKQGEQVGTKEIAGVRAKGFRVKHASSRWVVWADAASGVPLQAETTASAMSMDAQVVMEQFVLNPHLDPSLFDLTPPAGYTVHTMQMNVKTALEDEVVALLRDYAQATGGRFPARLNDWADIAKALLGGDGGREKGKEVAMTIGRRAGVIAGVMSQLSPDDYAYTPGDSKLGDSDKIVFWYKPPGAENYRAIFGDLRVNEVTAEQLPKD